MLFCNCFWLLVLTFLFYSCNYFHICIFYTHLLLSNRTVPLDTYWHSNAKKLCILNEFCIRLKHIAFILCFNIVSFTNLHISEPTDFVLSKSILSLSLSLSTASRLSAFIILFYLSFLFFCLSYIIFIHLISIFVNR